MPNTTTQFTKEMIQENIRTSIAWQVRVLEVLYARQTADEQANQETRQKNGRGFNGRDAAICSSFVEQVAKRRRYNNPLLLSEKQSAICARILPKYWAQVQEEIERKQAATAAV